MRSDHRYLYSFILLFICFWGITAQGVDGIGLAGNSREVAGQAENGSSKSGGAPGVALYESLQTLVRTHPGDVKSRIRLVRLMYSQSGLPEYLATRSLLWAENNSRSEPLRGKLPAVNPALVSECQKQLLRILDQDPRNSEALLMAGNCQLFVEQKQNALWYFHQALTDASDNQARLALADYYLQEWQPAEALQVVANETGPEIALRKGIAYLELNDYPMAYGFLLEAAPLPQAYRWTREKDLFKASLALGVTDRVQEYEKLGLPPEPMAATLFLELKGWSAWLDGNSEEALRVWNMGRALSPDYWVWEGAIWYLPEKPGVAADFPKGWNDRYLDSNLRLRQGDAYLQEGRSTQAYQSYLAAIKSDHRSLIGFLKAGEVQLKAKAYTKAIDLFSQALAVNPGFAPILLERATAYQRSGHSDLAAADRKAAGQALTGVMDGSIQAQLFDDGRNKVELILRGATRNLTGIWVYDGKTEWKWLPWWGSPIYLNGLFKQLWVVPVGPGLSGLALFLEKNSSPTPEPAIQVVMRDDGLWLESSFATRMVGEIIQNNSTRRIVLFDQLVNEGHIPWDLFPQGQSELGVGWQETSGAWRTAQYSLIRPALPSSTDSDTPGNNPEPPIQESSGTVGNRWDGGAADSVGADGPDFAIDYPKLLSIAVGRNGQRRWKLNWTVESGVVSSLEILTDTGIWKRIIPTGEQGRLRADIESIAAVFCRIRLENTAGRVSFYPVGQINEAWRSASSEAFVINDGTGLINSRSVQVSPVNQSDDLEWGISNDLRIWSPWHQGSAPVKWRMSSRDGSILLFVRYRYRSTPQFQRITVVGTTLDTVPPELRNLDWRKSGSDFLIDLQFDEAVQIQAVLTDISGQTIDSRDPADIYQSAVSLVFPLDRVSPGGQIQFLVRDQAGNTCSLRYGISNDGLEALKDESFSPAPSPPVTGKEGRRWIY